jgi:hypothetical protein
VAGAAVGNWLAGECVAGAGDGLWVTGGVLARAVCVGRGVWLGEVVADTEREAGGENEVGVADGDDAELQAARETAASMVSAAAPVAASLALRAVPAMVVRICWDLLTRPAGVWPVVCPGQLPQNAAGHKGESRDHAMACSSLSY